MLKVLFASLPFLAYLQMDDKLRAAKVILLYFSMVYTGVLTDTTFFGGFEASDELR